MAIKPKIPESFEELKIYPKQFESFFNDNYGFRKTLISWHNKITDKIFNESPLARVIIGKEGWLYFDNEDSILDVQGKAILEDDIISKGVKAFIENWNQAKNNNIDYLVIIAADKSTIYPEFLPDYISISDKHRIDKFLSALLSVEPNFPIVDLRNVLLEAKKNEVIYHKTDTHWNRRGAHYGYIQIMNKLNIFDKFAKAKFKPNLRKDFEDKAENYFLGDISEMINSDEKNLDYDLKEKFERTSKIKNASEEEKNKFHHPLYYINNKKSLPNVFVYHDSFFGNLYDFFSEHFYQSFYINEYPCNINLEVVKNHHSNIVIHQFWEGRINKILSSCE